MTKYGLSSGQKRRVAAAWSNQHYIGRAATLRAIPVRDDLKPEVIADAPPNWQMQIYIRRTSTAFWTAAPE